MNTIFVTASRVGRVTFFVADTLEHARRKAIEVAGTRYRFIAPVQPGHHLHARATRELGLDPVSFGQN